MLGINHAMPCRRAPSCAGTDGMGRFVQSDAFKALSIGAALGETAGQISASKWTERGT